MLVDRQSEQPLLLQDKEVVKIAIGAAYSKCLAVHESSSKAYGLIVTKSWPEVLAPGSAMESGNNSWISLITQCVLVVTEQTLDTCLNLDEGSGRMLASLSAAVETWRVTLGAYGFLVRMMSDDDSSKNRQVEWGRLLHGLMQKPPSAETLAHICYQISPVAIEQKAKMVFT